MSSPHTPSFTRAHAPLAPTPPEPGEAGLARFRRELIACAGLGILPLPIVALGGVVEQVGGGPVGFLVTWLGGGALLRGCALLGQRLGGAALGVFLAPRGDSTPHAYDFSREQALVQRGDVAGALAAYERRLAEAPGDVEARVRAAELYAGAGGDPQRAAKHLCALRRLPGLPQERDVYASNRLVDLYSGPLGEPGRALVELRRLSERYAGTRLGEEARLAVARRKAEARAEG